MKLIENLVMKLVKICETSYLFSLYKFKDWRYDI